MEMKNVLKNSIDYPKMSAIKPIILSAVATLVLSGCGADKLPQNKVIKPMPPVHIQVDKNSTVPEPPLGGVPPIQPLKK